METPADPHSGATEASPYDRGLKSHLATTERQLASLEEATPEERARLIETIIEQNRLYALAAERAGEPQLARVLRAFSPVLESMRQGEGNTAADAAQLSFEMRAMQSRLAGGPPAASGVVRSITGYSAPESPGASAFAAQAALDDAEMRLAVTLADAILQRLALSAGDWT